MKFNAVIDSKVSSNNTKSTGATYDLFKATITSGVLNGRSVLASRTTLNSNKEEKSTCEIDEEVVLHMDMYEGKPYFSIERQSLDIDSIEDILADLAKGAKQEQEVK